MSTITIKVPNWLDFIFTCPLLAYRLLRFGYTFRRIYLGEGEFAILDPQDYYRLCNFKWFLKGRYALRSFKIAPDKTKMISIHREIMNAPDGLLVDHKNGDGLDNRRSNLRLATHSQNQCNKPKIKTKVTSQYVGVHFDKRRSQWAANIRNNGKTIWLGRFDTEIDAAKAYDQAAKKHHGEFARLNFS
ncbi:MAG: AP2 domain-containing protein [Sedimentisphaerales bacterium]